MVGPVVVVVVAIGCHTGPVPGCVVVVAAAVAVGSHGDEVVMVEEVVVKVVEVVCGSGQRESV